jgi:hypothetical protein
MSQPFNPSASDQSVDNRTEEDPLVELARIVSGGNTFEDHNAPNPESDLAADLERELMADLDPALSAYPHGEDAPTYDQYIDDPAGVFADVNQQPAQSATAYETSPYEAEAYAAQDSNEYADLEASLAAEMDLGDFSPTAHEQPGIEPQPAVPHEYAAETAMPVTSPREDDVSPFELEGFSAEELTPQAAPVAPASASMDSATQEPEAGFDDLDFDSAFQAELDSQMVANTETAAVQQLAREAAPAAPQMPTPPAAAPLQPNLDPIPAAAPYPPAENHADSHGYPPETATQPAQAAVYQEPAADLGAFPGLDDPYQAEPQVSPAVVGAATAGAAAAGAMAPDAATQAHYGAANAESEGSRTKYIVAATFGGLLLIGGIAVFGFNSGGSGDAGQTEAALVEADPDPVKVKPENPGGVEIPNQDKAVYDRVGNGTDVAVAPNQDQLVEGAEQPIAIDRGVPKSEDRLGENTAALDNSANSLLAPRRVQTVVVKPDGTIVRVDPEDAGSVQATPAQQATGTDTPASVTDSGSTQVAGLEPLPETSPVSEAPSTPLLEGASASTGTIPLPQSAPAGLQINQPLEVARVEFTPPAATQTPTARVQPTPRATNPAPAANDASAPLQLATPGRTTNTQAAAQSAAPVVTQAPSSGGFVVQVSSQRSADAARASYANIQRRFPSVLGGRAANIQQATIEGRGTFFRVRVPAGSRSDAVNLCERLKSAGGSCFVSR